MSQAGPTSNRSRNVKKAANPNEFNQDKGKNHRRDSRPDNTSQQQSLESAGEGVDFKYREYGLDVVSNLRDNADVKASTGNEVVPNFKNRKRVDGGYVYPAGPGQPLQTFMPDPQQDLYGGQPSTGEGNSVKWVRVDGGYVYPAGPGRPLQTFMPDPQQDLQPGTYRIRNVLTGTILDPNDGTLVIGSTYSTGSNQTWNLEAGSNGYRFRNEASDTYLGYILKQDWVLRGLRNPVEWTVTKAGDGYSIRPAQMPKLVIDLANGNRGNNAKICLWSYHGGNNQLWRFESV